MGRKPTYEELERRVKWLEKEAGKRKKADGVLYQSKEKYQNILSSIEEGYYEVDLAGNLTFFNDSLCKIYGYARNELMGMNNRNYMTAETAKKTYKIFNRVYKTGEPTKIFDWEFIKKDGTKVDVEISVSLIRNPKGQAIGFRGIVRDIRERKRLEAALQKSYNDLLKVNKKLKQKNTELSSFINNVPDMAWLKDSESRFIAVNKTFGEAVGINTESLINQTCEVCFGKEAAKKFREDDQEVMKGKKQVTIVEKIKDSKKNEEVWLETIKSPIFDESGKVFGTVGIARDITHRELAENQLRESEENFRTLAENANDGILIAVGDGRHAYANIHASKITGYSVSELLKTTIKDLVHPDEFDKIKEIYRTINEGKLFKSKYETTILRKDGNTVPIEVTTARSKWHGKPADIVITRNISERKRFEEELQESKAMFEAVIESLPFDVFALDRNNRYILQNSTCKKNWGDLIGKSPNNVAVSKNTKDLWLQNNRRALSGETITGEVIYNRLNGDKSYYHNIISPIKKKEKIFGILGVLIDITEIKRVEDALRKSRERFRNLTEITSDWVWEIDKNSFYTYVSPKIRDILGYHPEEIIGKTPFDLMPPKEADRVFSIFNTIRDSQQPFHCLENINLHKNGHPVILETSGIPVFNTDGEFCGYRGVDREITERKKTEKELLESKESYRRLLETMNDGFGIQDKKGTITYVNRKFAQMLGYKPENLIGKSVTDLLDDRNKKILKNQIFIRKKGEVSPYEIEWKSKEGKNIPTIMSPQAIFDEKGQFNGSFSVITDISMLKQVEEELRKTHDELENRVAQRTIELEVQKSSLEETNIALQVLLEKRQEDKKEVEDNVLTNVKEMIAPYFEKFRKTKLDDQQKAILNIVESNLNEIISPFSRKMSLKYLNLTPTEIHVANLIRYGSDSKEIADIMGLSPRTIYNHRKNIRRKFGLENKKTNLRSHLLSIY